FRRSVLNRPGPAASRRVFWPGWTTAPRPPAEPAAPGRPGAKGQKQTKLALQKNGSTANVSQLTHGAPLKKRTKPNSYSVSSFTISRHGPASGNAGVYAGGGAGLFRPRRQRHGHVARHGLELCCPARETSRNTFTSSNHKKSYGFAGGRRLPGAMQADPRRGA